MVTAEVGARVFDPKEMSTPEQQQQRLVNYIRASVELASDNTKSPAEKGARLADAFSELTQDRNSLFGIR